MMAVRYIHRSHFRRWLVGAAKIGFTCAILAYLVATLDWASIGANLLRSDPSWLALAEMGFGVSLTLAALRWDLLLRVQGIRLPVLTAEALTLVSQFFNLFLLGSLGGDAAKLVLVCRLAPENKTHAAVSILTDRIVGLAVLLLCLLALLPLQTTVFGGGSETAILRAGLWTSVATLGTSLAFLAFFPFEKLAERCRSKTAQQLLGHRWVTLAISGIRKHHQNPVKTLGVILLSLLLWASVFMGGYCAARGIGLGVGWLEISMILGIVIVASSLPISIGGHGVREGGFMLMFAMYGIAVPVGFAGRNEAAIAYSFLFFLLWAFWGLIGGLVFLFHRGTYPTAAVIAREIEHETGVS